jgi:hypothetical protein
MIPLQKNEESGQHDEIDKTDEAIAGNLGVPHKADSVVNSV